MKNFDLKDSEIINMQYFEDFPDGNLYIGEGLKNIPFNIKRVYYINKLSNHCAIRGKHAHRKLEQVIFCVNGSFILVLDNGKVKNKFLMDSPKIGVRIRKMIWHEMKDFSKDCVILVLASDYYRKDDYIRDYSDFIRILSK